MAKKNKKVETSNDLDINFKYKQLEEANALLIVAKELVKNTKGTNEYDKSLENFNKAREAVTKALESLS